ncbi:MAG: alpha-hydroxy-acid oxidizing protein, partial [Pseudomonadota bacterium]
PYAADIADAVGGEIEIILDGGIRRGSHVLKALAMGANACSGGRLYLYALAAAGTEGVRRAMTLLRDEIERNMMLMGCTSLDALNRRMLARRAPLNGAGVQQT